jgi:lipopolysaccharide exporter
MKKSVLAHIANGLKWTAVSRISIQLIGLISTIILARLLSPHDFGLVALGMIFISFLTMLGSFDFDTVLIQHPNPDRQHYDTAWTLNALYFAVASIGLVASAPLLARFYKTPQLSDIIYVLAFGFFLEGFVNVKIIDFQKHFRFRYEAILKVSVKLAGFCATVIAAFLLRSYWALLIGMLTTRVTRLALSYALAPYKPRPTLSKTRELFSFSSWLVLSAIIGFFHNKAPDIIIGKTLGVTPLGVFTVGQSTAGMVTSEITATIYRAAYPGFAKVSHSEAEFSRTVLRIFNIVATVTLPASIGISYIALPFVLTVFGQKWLSAVPILQIIAIASLINALQSNQYVLLSLRKPGLQTFILTIRLALIFPLIYLFSTRYGIVGAAFGILLSGVLLMPVNLFLLMHFAKLRLFDLVHMVWRPLVATALMGGALQIILNSGRPLIDQVQVSLLLLGMIVTGIVVYSVSLLSLWHLSGRPTDTMEAVALRWLSDKTALFNNSRDG